MEKLTQWFDGSKDSPARIGWYECRNCYSRHWWDGRGWFVGPTGKKFGGLPATFHWRGLSRKPRSRA
jgi:hypothetical protein